MIGGLLLLVLTAGGSPPETKDLYQLGKDLCNDGKMAEALPIFQKLTKENPDYPFAWLGLGWSLYYTGHAAEALPAYQKALDLGAWSDDRVLLEIARAKLETKDRAGAEESLRKAVAKGLPNTQRFAKDKHLEGLAGEPWFADLMGTVDVSKMSRTEAWTYDLKLYRREIERLHYRPFEFTTKQDLDAKFAQIESNIPKLDDDQLTVEVMKIAHNLGDGHTLAEPQYVEVNHQQAIPVLIACFDDGTYITATDAPHKDLLWAQITKIEGQDIGDVYAKVRSISPEDNERRGLSTVPRFYRYPQLLHGLGISPNREKVTMTIIDREGKTRNVTLAIEPTIKQFVRTPDSSKQLPKYVGNRSDLYWYSYDEASKLLYFQYNGCGDKDDESVEQFAKRLGEFTDGHDVNKFVIDLRWNGGGNNFLNTPLLQMLCRPKINQPGKLFAIIGRHTFSAATVFATQIERFTNAIMVGEPTGSPPNFVGENCYVTLPHSQITVSLSNLYWQNSHAMDHRVWIAPKIRVPWDFASYREGKDPAMEAIARY